MMETYNFPSDHFSFYGQYHQEFKSAGKPLPTYRAALHSVRKFPGKNVITKKPIAPMPPTPPKIYKVDAVDFKDVVQKLTGAEEFLPTRLQEVAPPRLDLCPAPLHRRTRENEEKQPSKLTYDNSTIGPMSPLGFNLSPASIAWCSTVLMSPGTVSSSEPSAVV